MWIHGVTEWRRRWVSERVFVYDGIKVAPITQTSVWRRRFLTFPHLLMYPIIPSVLRNYQTLTLRRNTLNVTSIYIILSFQHFTIKKRSSKRDWKDTELLFVSQTWDSACGDDDVCVNSHSQGRPDVSVRRQSSPVPSAHTRVTAETSLSQPAPVMLSSPVL